MLIAEILYEVVLPLRVRQQPLPPLNENGDCGPCVIAGLTGLDILDIYQITGGIDGFDYYRMKKTVDILEKEGQFDRVVTDVPFWNNINDCFKTWGHPAHLLSSTWYRYIRMALDAGYYGIAQINFDHEGGTEGIVDHVVLIVGARTYLGTSEDYEGTTKRSEILISCSSTKSPDELWVSAGDFLRLWGGFNSMLVRPSFAWQGPGC